MFLYCRIGIGSGLSLTKKAKKVMLPKKSKRKGFLKIALCAPAPILGITTLGCVLFQKKRPAALRAAGASRLPQKPQKTNIFRKQKRGHRLWCSLGICFPHSIRPSPRYWGSTGAKYCGEVLGRSTGAKYWGEVLAEYWGSTEAKYWAKYGGEVLGRSTGEVLAKYWRSTGEGM